MEQLLGISDSNDPCQNPTAGLPLSNPGGVAVPGIGLLNPNTCYNVATGVPATCPVSGVLQSGAPSNNGPFGTPQMPGIGNLNWGVLAAVLAGLVVFAAVSK